MGVEPSTRCVHGNTLSIRPGALLDHCWGQVIYHQVEGGGGFIHVHLGGGRNMFLMIYRGIEINKRWSRGEESSFFK